MVEQKALHVIHSVMKAIRILSLFSPEAPRLSLTEISHRLELPKSTTYNLLNTLTTAGFVERVDGDQYALGTAIIGLTPNVRVNVELRDRAAPMLRRLADASGESVYLTVRDGLSLLYIYAIESSGRLLARTAVGIHAPLYCTSVGKAVMAHLTEAELDHYYAVVPLKAFTAETITDESSHRREMNAIRERGYSTDNQEHEAHTYCLGAPIFDATGHVIGACSVSGADPDIIAARRPELSERILSTAQEISRHMGYFPTRSKLGRTAV